MSMFDDAFDAERQLPRAACGSDRHRSAARHEQAALSQFFPIRTAAEALADTGTPEKQDLKVGFIPITCAGPIVMAAPLGFRARPARCPRSRPSTDRASCWR